MKKENLPKFLRSNKLSGIDPEMFIRALQNSRSLTNLSILRGMVPSNALKLTLSFCKDSPMLDIKADRSPLNIFPSISSNSSDVREPIDSGMAPLSLLLKSSSD